MVKQKLLACLLAIIFMPSCNQKNKKTSINPEVETARTTQAQLKKALIDKGFQIFDYVDEETGDTVLLQQYYIVFLKKGPFRSQSQSEADSLQALHLKHLGRMYREGYADMFGPFGDDGEIRGITIYNTPTHEMADSLARLDPMIKTGRLVMEIHPWWAAKGYGLR